MAELKTKKKKAIIEDEEDSVVSKYGITSPSTSITSAPFMTKWEKKFTTHFFTGQTLTQFGDIYCINDIAGGTDYDERVGRRVKGEYVDFEWTVQHPTAAGQTDRVRVMVVVDHQSNAIQLVNTTLLDTGVCSNFFAAPLNTKNFMNRFHVLLDWRSGALVNYTGGVFLSGETTKHMKIRLRRPSDMVVFSDQTASVPTHNALYVVLFSQTDSATSAQNAYVSFCVNYYYSDA